MPPTGRPRALDEFKRREVCALVATGCGIEGAARYVGVNPTTIRREALRNPEFHDQLRNAELANQLDPLRAMRKAAATHWRAAAWLLERTLPDRFARRNPDSISPAQLDQILTQVVETICEEAPGPEVLQRMVGRVQATLRGVLREGRAISHTRRDPHSARRRSHDRTAPYPPPTLVNQHDELPTAEPQSETPSNELAPDA